MAITPIKRPNGTAKIAPLANATRTVGTRSASTTTRTIAQIAARVNTKTSCIKRRVKIATPVDMRTIPAMTPALAVRLAPKDSIAMRVRTQRLNIHVRHCPPPWRLPTSNIVPVAVQVRQRSAVVITLLRRIPLHLRGTTPPTTVTLKRNAPRGKCALVVWCMPVLWVIFRI